MAGNTFQIRSLDHWLDIVFENSTPSPPPTFQDYRDFAGSLYTLIDTALSSGSLYREPQTVTPIAVADTFVPLVGATTPNPANANFEQDVDGRLTYTGDLPLRVQALAMAGVGGPNNNTASLALAKNGSLVADTASGVMVTTLTEPVFLAAQGIIPLLPGDYVEVWGTLSTSGDLETERVNLLLNG